MLQSSVLFFFFFHSSFQSSEIILCQAKKKYLLIGFINTTTSIINHTAGIFFRPSLCVLLVLPIPFLFVKWIFLFFVLRRDILFVVGCQLNTFTCTSWVFSTSRCRHFMFKLDETL